MNTSLIILIFIAIFALVQVVVTIKTYLSVGKTTLSNTKKNKKKNTDSIDYNSIIDNIIDEKITSNGDLNDIYYNKVSDNSMSYIDFLKSLNAKFMLSSYYRNETSIQKFKSLVSTVISEEESKEHFNSISAKDKLSIDAIVKNAEEKGIDQMIKPELNKLAISMKESKERIKAESIRNKLSIYVSIGSLIFTVISLLYTVLSKQQ